MVILEKYTNLKRGKENKSMVYDLIFEEAMDILKNKIGWVQGERFDEHEYLAIDRRSGYLIKNVVDDRQFGCVFDFWGDQTKEVWTNTDLDIPEEYKTQKYRFILILNRDSVKGVGIYSKGNSKNDYLWHKSMTK